MLHRKTENYEIHLGSNLDVLPEIPDNSIDAIITDPPYEIGFMGRGWDRSGIAYNVDLWRECLRVLKPGGHLLAFGATRTWHRVAVSIEDAGFELRDSIAWIYSSGFPKSLNISKAIDKAAGAEREVIGVRKQRANSPDSKVPMNASAGEVELITAPATEEAKRWDGWGTALKPAFEPIVVGRKPLEGTVVENVLKYGTGGINIDKTRIGDEVRVNAPAANKPGGSAYNLSVSGMPQDATPTTAVGRWPANVLLDQGAAFQVGPDASFFYISKANAQDRNEGLDHLPKREIYPMNNSKDRKELNATADARVQNHHPTVKPTDLMRYLVRLVCPEGGTVLDVFAGSGSTGKGAILEGRKFIGIELTEDYIPIIEGRLDHIERKVQQDLADRLF